jgi:hypothetical protein
MKGPSLPSLPSLPRFLPELPAGGEPGTGLCPRWRVSRGPVHDSAYFEDLTGRLYGLVIIFSDRLPADQAE